MILDSSYSRNIIPECSFNEYALSIIKTNQGVALVDAYSDDVIKFEDVELMVRKFGSVLAKRGIQNQDVVAVCVSNTIYYPALIMGVSALNAITTPCNPNYTKDELVVQFKLCNPKLIITDSKQVEKMRQVAQAVPSIKEVLCVDSSPKVQSIVKLMREDDGSACPTNVKVNPKEDVVLLPYSSGTTGVPKGVMLTHYNFIANHTTYRGAMKVPPWSVVYTVLPMFHAYGLMMMFSNLFGGCKHIIAKRFHLEKTLADIEKHRVTSFPAAPPILLNLTKNDALLKKYDLSSLMMVMSGAAPLPESVNMETMVKTQSMVLQGWGLTECIAIAATTVPGCPLNSVGFLMPNVSLKVIDVDSGKELGVDEDGELLVKAPHVFAGYYKNPEQTANCMADGWFRTGDVGHFDSRGIVYIVDRIKELIKYKGFQVAPAELEEILVSHPDIEDAAVIGIPNTEAGEVPRAFVVRKNATITEEAIKKFVEGKVVRYKFLRGGVEFVDVIPKSPTGKILRRVLKKKVMDSLSAKL